MDILNFISWIKGKRIVTAVDPASTVLPVGLRDPRRDDNYLTGAITVQDFAAQMPAGPTGVQGPIGPQGVPGPVGPAGLNWQGSWSALGTYVIDDAVGYGGASWFCIDPVGPSATTPDADFTNWALLAQQGSPGTAGPQGVAGVPGPNSITVNTTAIASGATERLLFQSTTNVVTEDARLKYVVSRGSLVSTGKLNNVNNTALGDYALSATTGAGLYNTAVGYQALRNLSTGADNVAIGNGAAAQVNNGNANVAIGKAAMGFGPTNATGLVAIGANALVNAPTGSVAVGASALSFTTGTYNTALGQEAGINVLTGTGNVFIGPQTGNATTTGDYNIFIGLAAGYTGNFTSTCVIGQGSPTANNQMVIGEVGSEFGTVAAQVNTSTKYWEVTINGVVQKILLA
jgi:hypothetical protein